MRRERAPSNTLPPLAFPLSTVAVDICSAVLCQCALEMDEEARHFAYCYYCSSPFLRCSLTCSLHALCLLSCQAYGGEAR
jgi:hypothetical protein